jgi:putative oxidoreductase
MRAAICTALERLATPVATGFLLLVRLFWGWQFAETGWGKLHHLGRVTQFFTSLGIPFPAFSAALVGSIEFAGGVFLILGLAARFWALLLSVSLAVAYLTDGRQQLLALFSDASKFYGYDAFPFLFASLVILSFGAGAIALDAIFIPQLRRRCFA